MSDLIDRDKLLEVLEERKKPNNGGEDGTKERYRYMQWLTDYNAVIEAPTAEPKKGKWTNDASCPFCGFQPWYERDIHTLSFCPNCGADMRGEKE